MSTLLLQLINGFSYGFLLFIITCGITIVFGILGVLNLAHGSFYLLGSYLGYSLIMKAGLPFWAALAAVPLIIAVLGYMLETIILRPTYKLGHLSQVLLTFGLAYIFHDLFAILWGKNMLVVDPPPALNMSIQLAGYSVPAYRIALIVIGLAIAIFLWFFQEKTKWGAVIRAGLSDKEMAAGLGVNIHLVFTFVFVLGSLFAGVGGVIGSPILGAFPGMEFQILILSLVVLVVGGLGSVSGTLIASLLVGFVETFSRYLVPELSLIITFALMAVVLVVRPQGLIGRRV
ncbi:MULTISPECIES: branched-chain amino acid ABC transporter permease [Neobacillus]|uniref:Branched-chain amino acid ABC transporter permease n=1 Tax=Neobacillus rhizophilus TaxID=2833579 RepID=A0A942U427_9BACI|nr:MULTISPECIES: branched-chain amino acid ABC transporter permease [Neobacillus]MBS4214326.1 branched-chain amino acid ABC transporter permease [Neobacillus rhizophilus]MBU8915881.1 branched-chain amino acid ABC transporter permease [Bacillus sp. FJAT-29953]